MTPDFSRILLKLSGETLQGSLGYGIDVEFLDSLTEKVVELAKKIEVVIVIGWGNIFRGAELSKKGLDRSSGDYMGMLATVINGIALCDSIERKGGHARVMSAVEVDRVSELFIRRRAMKHLKEWRVVICVSGTGNPYCTTDSAGVLRALELECSTMVKATKVDGIYNKDPKKHADAVRYDTLSLREANEKNLKVMDPAAIALAREEELPLFVCRIEDIDKLAGKNPPGTFVYPEKKQ